MVMAATEAAKAAAEGVAKAAEDADAATHEVKKEKVRKQHNLTKTAHRFNPAAHRAFALLACVQDESSETTEKKADAANTQDAKICVDYEPCKKTEGCSRMCLIGRSTVVRAWSAERC